MLVYLCSLMLVICLVCSCLNFSMLAAYLFVCVVNACCCFRTFSIFTRHELLECCCLIRARTLDVMLSILKESSFPSSKVSGMVYQKGAAVGFLLAAPCFGGSFQLLNAVMPLSL